MQESGRTRRRDRRPRRPSLNTIRRSQSSIGRLSQPPLNELRLTDTLKSNRSDLLVTGLRRKQARERGDGRSAERSLSSEPGQGPGLDLVSGKVGMGTPRYQTPEICGKTVPGARRCTWNAREAVATEMGVSVRGRTGPRSARTRALADTPRPTESQRWIPSPVLQLLVKS